jgi:transcription elongation GreA/GreB family factor
VVDSDGDEIDYFLAPAENKVPGMILASPSSPVGSALLGASVGEVVSYQAPAGVFSLKITSVRPFEG